VSTYFDHNATTPVAPEVVAAMAEALASTFGNASSVHAYGQRAKAAIDEARSSVATLIGAEAAEVVFTAGGTEADNFALAAPPRRWRRAAASALSAARSSTKPSSTRAGISRAAGTSGPPCR
jgi:cysteine desulfurase